VLVARQFDLARSKSSWGVMITVVNSFLNHLAHLIAYHLFARVHKHVYAAQHKILSSSLATCSNRENSIGSRAGIRIATCDGNFFRLGHDA
jgi:hypothetical protein